MSFDSHPPTATVAQLQAEIALLRLQVRSALMSAQANADTIVQLSSVVHTQGSYIETLDAHLSKLTGLVSAQGDNLDTLEDLWRAHLQASLMRAADDVYDAFLSKDEPDPSDVLQVDLWHDESLTRRIN